MAGRCCVKRGSIAFAKSQLMMIGLLFASGASSSSSSPSSSHGNHATKWHLVTRLLGLPLVPLNYPTWSRSAFRCKNWREKAMSEPAIQSFAARFRYLPLVPQ